MMKFTLHPITTVILASSIALLAACSDSDSPSDNGEGDPLETNGVIDSPSDNGEGDPLGTNGVIDSGDDSISVEQPTTETVITSSISLADYTGGSGNAIDFPDMTDAVIVDDKLFVLLENLEGFAPNRFGYLAVIDTNTNLEIDTGAGEFPRQGIELSIANPTELHYNEDTGLLYVTGRGNAFNNSNFTGDDSYTGGIESIDPTTYATALILDDGTAEANNGFFTDAVVISDTLGYVITLDGFNTDFTSISNLRSFNPSTGEVSEPIDGTAGEPAQESLATTLIPSDLIFMDVPRQ